MSYNLRSTKVRPAALAALLLVLLLIVAACAAPGVPADPVDPAIPAEAAEPTGGSEPADAGDDVRSKGSADAPVTILEYSDYQCPFCSRWVDETYPVILQEYIDSGKVRLEFRDFPLDSLHPNATPAAVAARCAGEQGDYWGMHDLLFGNQGQWSNVADPSELFTGYAGEMGLDTEAFAGCLTSGQFDEAIAQDLLAGQMAGITGTPSFLLNGNLLVGAQPASVFQQALDTLLAGGTLEDPNAAAQQPQQAPEPVDIPIAGAPVKGDPNAPMTIVEYSDYQCPFCSRFAEQTLPTLLQEYIDSGQAKLVFKDFPLESIHPNAQKAAEAARCVRELAGSDDSYWAMHDALFANQAEWSGSRSATGLFAGYASEIGVDAAAFDECLTSDRFAEAVQADLVEGLNFGVQGTPTFFIDGQPFVGAQPIENFRQAIGMVQEGLSIAPPPQPTPAPEPTPAPLTEDIPLEDAAGMKGDPNAPVVVVEYSDYQCPFCQRHFSEVLPQLQPYIDDGTVLYVFKDFPLTSIHPQAPKAAEAARCAGDQEAYWPMHDLLFQNQQQWSGQATAVDIFKGYAGQLGLNQTTFDQCLDSGQHAAVVEANLQEGVGFGVRGTPAFFINRTLLPGAYPIEAFQQLIQEAQAQQ
ncbi:MAG TPA: thioredoxin domain-containing protein [Anaerolineae bacterium]|nr:thioredoxin domain-containing protein [Anaerolineae bacterium]